MTSPNTYRHVKRKIQHKEPMVIISIPEYAGNRGNEYALMLQCELIKFVII